MQFTKALQHTVGLKALTAILTFGINLLMVRILGAVGSGGFFYAIALLTFFTLAISWCMESGITYYAIKNQSDIPSIIIFIMPWLVLQAIASWLLLHFLNDNPLPQLSWVFVISNLMMVYFSALFYAKKWFISLNVIVSLVNVMVLLSLALVYLKYGDAREQFYNPLPGQPGPLQPKPVKDVGNIYHTQGGYMATLVYVAGFLCQALALAVFFLVKIKLPVAVPVFNPNLIRNIFYYSTIALISNLLFFLVTRIDYFFVDKYCSAVALGNYVQVSKMGQLLVLLPSMMAGVIFPYSTAENNEGYLAKLQSLCRLTGLLFVAAAAIIILTGYWMFPFLYGDGLNMMYPAILLYLPGYYCLGMVTLLAAYVAGKGLIQNNMIASSIALVAVIAGDVLLIPQWGIYAAAAVSSLAYFLCMVYLLWIYKKGFGVSPASFFIAGRGDIQFLLSRLKK